MKRIYLILTFFAFFVLSLNAQKEYLDNNYYYYNGNSKNYGNGKEISTQEEQEIYINIQNQYDNLVNEFNDLGYGYIFENLENGEFSEEIITEMFKFLARIDNVSNISDGIYVLKLYLSNGEVENKKIVKQRNNN